MSEFDIPAQYSVIARGLKKLGLEYDHAAKHDVATCVATRNKTMIPRHKILNKYIVGSICDFLLKNGYSSDEIKKAFKWR